VRIKSIEPIAISLPMKKPVKMAGETVSRADNILVRIESDNGVVGWGEAAAAPTMTGETVASMMTAVAHMAPGLLRRAADDFAGVSVAMDAQMYGNTGAKAAIEIALHDLVGRATGQPLHVMLGGKRRERIPLLTIIGSDDAAADLRDAQDRRKAGFAIYKIKVGVDTPEADAARTRDVCAVLDQDCLISADANQGWNAEQGVRYVRAVGDCGLAFFEQPVPAHDLAGMALVAAASSVLIGADEGIHSPDDIERHHERKAARGVSLKAIKLGGVQAVLAAGKLCDRLGMKLNISCKTGETSVASAAAMHVAATVPSLVWGLTITSPGLAEDIVIDPLRVDGGHLAVLDRPGLGVEVDERRVRRWQQEFTARKVA
jgi:L-alanine-DL-glutamate epimerase-like enolase superfamily enzyme